MGLPSLQALVGGGCGCFCLTFFRGGLENYLGGGGLNSGVWDGVLLFVSQVFFYWILWVGPAKLQFQVAGMHAMLCSVVVCCGLVRCNVVS